MLSATSLSSMPSPLQGRAATTVAPAGVDRDGDRDNDTTESPAAKVTESQGGASTLPTAPYRGRTLNITA